MLHTALGRVSACAQYAAVQLSDITLAALPSHRPLKGACVFACADAVSTSTFCSAVQLTSTTLTALASTLADEHCCVRQLVLSFNPQMPPALDAAATLLAAQQADPATHWWVQPWYVLMLQVGSAWDCEVSRHDAICVSATGRPSNTHWVGFAAHPNGVQQMTRPLLALMLVSWFGWNPVGQPHANVQLANPRRLTFLLSKTALTAVQDIS